jgi:hypothetical protein
MDQATVLAIIEMIKTRYETCDDLYHEMLSLPLSLNSTKSAEYAGMCNAYHELINYLDSYIEPPLYKKVENSTGE